MANPKKNLNYDEKGIASWYDLALETFIISKKIGLINKQVNLIPISTNQYKTKAMRPLYSVLDCKLSRLLLNIEQKHWEINLNEILTNIYLDKIKVK